MNNKEVGLFHKFKVERTLDPEGKHDGCRYFVLDPQHDPIAREVLRVYAEHANRLEFEELAKDLWQWLGEEMVAHDSDLKETVPVALLNEHVKVWPCIDYPDAKITRDPNSFAFRPPRVHMNGPCSRDADAKEPEPEVDRTCPSCGLPAEIPGEGRFCGNCQDYEGHCTNDHCMTCGGDT